MKRLAFCFLALCLLSLSAAAQTTPKLTVSELLKVKRVGDPQLSPNGEWVAYTIAIPNVDANRNITQVYLIPTKGGEPRQLTTGDRSTSSPRWSPDGKNLAVISSKENGPQIWLIDVASGQSRRVSNISTGAADPIWSPDGKWLAFVSDVHPECADDACNKQKDEQRDGSKVKAQTADSLLYRHWTSWKEGRRTHIFIVPAEGGVARDLTPGDFDAPPFSLGGPTDYAFSPDSKELAFARNTDKDGAYSTNGDIFTVSVDGGEPKRVTGQNRGADLSPLYSPDGRYIAFRSQETPGFESDRWRLMLYDRKSGEIRNLTAQFNDYVEGFTFSPDGKTVYFASGQRGLQPVYALDIASGALTKRIADGFNDDVKVSNDGRTLVFSRSSMATPTEIFVSAPDGTGVRQLTHANDSFIAGFKLRPAESVEWQGAENARVHGWVVRPPDFDASKEYPMVVLVHGGPQGAWGDNWGYRWNPQVFAAAGYVVFLPNPRGSTGYGQQFTNEVSGDWGGKAYTDIMNGTAHVLSLGYVDKARIGAAGGSYGGYMVNWILGHNNDPRFQFAALVSHAGVFNLTSMYGATEELWFPEWEFKGSPWTNPEMYAKWSPIMFAKDFKTPTLVVHGELDYRVPVTEGLQLFTALQKQGVPSKLLYFPDEGHWVLKPQNSSLWYTTVIGWFDKYLK